MQKIQLISSNWPANTSLFDFKLYVASKHFSFLSGKKLSRVIFLLLFPLAVLGQPPIQIGGDFDMFPLKNQLSYYSDSTGKLTLNYIQKHFAGIPIHSTYPNFGDSPNAYWLRFRLQNTEKYPKKILLITKGIDSLQIYLLLGDTLIEKFPPNGSHVPIFQRDKISPFLFETLELHPQQIYTVWVRIRNVHYPLAASPFDLYSVPVGLKMVFTKHFLYSIYIGSMFLILLVGLGLASSFREPIYWYYLGCVSCALTIMLAYNDFGYLFVNHLPNFIINKNIFGILSATVPVFYLLFAEQFLEIRLAFNRKTFIMSRTMMFVQFLLMILLLAMDKALFDYKWLFHPFMSGFSAITLYYLFIQFHKSQAKIFLTATVPVTISVILESFSEIYPISVQNIHDIYYFTTLFELLMLTLGIIRRFKNIEQDKFRLKQEKYALENELLVIESQAKNEISSRIAEKLHNSANADIVVSKNKIATLQQVAGPSICSEDWIFVQERLNSAYTLLRDLSHQLEKTVNTQSLVLLLMSRYQGESMVEISYEGIQPDIAIDNRKELVLFSVLSEAITNALKYAQCSKIEVQIAYEFPSVTIILEDNGIGFEYDTALSKGMGLSNIKRQVEQTLKGSIVFDSNENGTTIIIKVLLGS